MRIRTNGKTIAYAAWQPLRYRDRSSPSTVRMRARPEIEDRLAEQGEAMATAIDEDITKQLDEDDCDIEACIQACIEELPEIEVDEPEEQVVKPVIELLEW